VSRFQAPWHDWIGREQGILRWKIVSRFGKSWRDSTTSSLSFIWKGLVTTAVQTKSCRDCTEPWRDFGLLWLVFKWFLQHFWRGAEARGLGFTKGGTWGLSIFVRRISRVGINIVNTLGSEIKSLEGSKASFVYSLVRFIWEWWGKQMVEIREKADFL